MKKKVFAAITIALGFALAGCETPSVASEVPFERKPVPVVIVEPTETVSDAVGYEIGEDVGIVLHADDCAPASAFGGVVVAQTEYYAIISPYWCGEDVGIEELLWDLFLRSDDEQVCLYLFPLEDIYSSVAEAQAVADKENGNG